MGIDEVAEHNRRMWERLARAGIPYTRPQGTPPASDRGKRRFLDPHARLAGMDLRGARVLSLAGGGGWEPVLFAELGAEVTLFDISERQLRTVRALARSRDVKVRTVQGDMRDLSVFPDASFELVSHCHSLVFVPDADRVIAEVGRVLAAGGVYHASTMHPATLRMYGTWTGTGWRVKKSYFADGPMEVADPTWEFGDLTVKAETLEYGHRISDLVNACAAAGMVLDGMWEWSPGEISTRVPVRQMTGEREAEPGSDDHLESLMPAFVEWRARRLATRPGSSPRARSAARPRASRSGSRRGTASRSG